VVGMIRYFCCLGIMCGFWMAPVHASAPEALPDRVDRWMESVVLLVTGPAWCTGVVIDEKGTVATAYHCVASGLKPEIRTRNGDQFIGSMVAADPKNDVALVFASDLAGVVQPLPIREDSPRQGETLYGLGHPFAPAAGRTMAMEGMLQWSVSAGIVSAVGPRLIQTDAALNPGNSGGPAVDVDGRIIGIVSRKLGGDNVAFLSSAENLSQLIERKTRPSPFGGQISMGLSSLAPTELNSASGLGLNLAAIIRDRLVIQGLYMLDQNARGVALERGSAWGPTFEVTGALRQRFGRGNWSTAVDVGGGLVGTQEWYAAFNDVEHTWAVTRDPEELALAAFGRISFGGVGLRFMSLPMGRGSLVSNGSATLKDPTYMLAIDLDLPGVLATF
jgi:S1-C subfamily serine protease